MHFTYLYLLNQHSGKVKTTIQRDVLVPNKMNEVFALE